jgi:uncharacterized protein
MTVATSSAHYPGRAPIDSYGNGGFRFAGMSHRGSILCLPSGIYAWSAAAPADLTLQAFAAVICEARELQILLLGTGSNQVFPPREIRRALEAAGFGVEPMATGAAARTYNVLLAEGRRVGAALLAVD